MKLKNLLLPLPFLILPIKEIYSQDTINLIKRPNPITQEINSPTYLTTKLENLKSKSEIISLFKEVIYEDKTDTINSQTKNYKCADFSKQFAINTFGAGKDAKNPPAFPNFYDFSNNGKFNLPVLGIYLSNPKKGYYHVVNAMLVGENSENLKDYFIFDPQNDKEINILNDSRMQGGKVEIRYLKTDILGFPEFTGFLYKFKIENNQSKLIETNSEIEIIGKRNLEIPTNQKETNLENQINIYPNPIQNIATFEFPKNSLENKLIISNISGNKIFNKTIYDNKFNYDFSNLPSGMYIATIIQDNKTTSKKLIKK